MSFLSHHAHRSHLLPVNFQLPTAKHLTHHLYRGCSQTSLLSAPVTCTMSFVNRRTSGPCSMTPLLQALPFLGLLQARAHSIRCLHADQGIRGWAAARTAPCIRDRSVYSSLDRHLSKKSIMHLSTLGGTKETRSGVGCWLNHASRSLERQCFIASPNTSSCQKGPLLWWHQSITGSKYICLVSKALHGRSDSIAAVTFWYFGGSPWAGPFSMPRVKNTSHVSWWGWGYPILAVIISPLGSWWHFAGITRSTMEGCQLLETQGGQRWDAVGPICTIAGWSSPLPAATTVKLVLTTNPDFVQSWVRRISSSRSSSHALTVPLKAGKSKSMECISTPALGTWLPPFKGSPSEPFRQSLNH